MTIICVALLCPVVITVLALLIQACAWYYSVLHPLMTFDGSRVYDEIHPLFGTSINDNSPTNDGIPYILSVGEGLINSGEASLKYVVHIVEFSNTNTRVPHQYKVIQSIRKHLLKTLGSIHHPSIEFKVIQTIAADNELQKLVRFEQVENEWLFMPYLSIHDIDAYMSSSESIYQSSTGNTLDCTSSTSCKVLTFAYLTPDYTAHSQMFRNENGATNNNTIHYKPLQLIDSQFIPPTLLQPPEIITGLVVPKLGCFSVLDMQNKHQNNAVDVDVIYNAATTSVECLQKLMGIRENTEHVSTSVESHSSPGTSKDNTLIDLDRTLTISSQQKLQFQRSRLTALTLAALVRLQALISLYRYNSDVTALLTLTATQRNVYREIFEILNKVKTTLVVDGGSPSSTTDSTCLHTLHTLVHQLYKQVLALETDPSGGLKAPVPIEQYFAIFGPYWLPILVPVYRAFNSIIAAT